MCKGIIALVGRENVGKSTLFNRLSRSKSALVSDTAGLTRDRQYAHIIICQHECLLIDTGGVTQEKTAINQGINAQINQALLEADLIYFLVSARTEINSIDFDIAHRLRKLEKLVLLVINKSEHLSQAEKLRFYELGLGEPCYIAAEHNIGIEALTALSAKKLKLKAKLTQKSENIGVKKNTELPECAITVAILGKPNVGKSTLINQLLGKERVLTLDIPGTTRDSIYIPFEHGGKNYMLIDTAGIRRKKNVHDKIEVFSIIKALESARKAHAIILLLDAQQGVTDQDLNLFTLAFRQSASIIVCINKWDKLTSEQKHKVQRQLDLKFSFAPDINYHFISALNGLGVGNLYNIIDTAHTHTMANFSTAKLNKILENACTHHPPSFRNGRRIRLKFITQIANHPPTFMIHGNQVSKISKDYQRYLVNFFRPALKLNNTPIILKFKDNTNPFKQQKKTPVKKPF